MVTIGITCNMQAERKTFNVAEYYAQSILAVGALPVLLGPVDTARAKAAALRLDGLVLSGGMDVDPMHYGEPKHEKIGEIIAARDEFEFLLTRAFLDEGKPILGICRGHQLLNVVMGGTLWQDIPSQLGVEHPSDTWHDVANAPDSFLAALYGERLQVNSFHHQAVKDLGKGLRAVAHTTDECAMIEAVEGTDLPVYGVQWHPEQMWQRDGREDMRLLFAWFAQRCSAAQGSRAL